MMYRYQPLKIRRTARNYSSTCILACIHFYLYKNCFDSPCVQSPMKAKVAAFEKQMQESSRQTRTKTRQLAKQNSETSLSSTNSTNSTSKLPKPTTPSVETKYTLKEHTAPLEKSVLPSKNHSVHNLQKSQLTLYKVASLSKPTSAQPPKARSRDNSVEDVGRGKEVSEVYIYTYSEKRNLNI